MTADSSKIARLDYHPPGRNLDLEIFRVSQLRQRVSKQQMQTCHRYDFHLLIFVSHGKPDQLVDFRPVACRSGSVLFVRPGQLHDFGPDMEWDGWMLLFRPEFLAFLEEGLPGLARGRTPQQKHRQGAGDPNVQRHCSAK